MRVCEKKSINNKSGGLLHTYPLVNSLFFFFYSKTKFIFF